MSTVVLVETGRAEGEVEALTARLRPYFRRGSGHRRADEYVRGLLGLAERKNGWQLAEQAGHRHRRTFQRVLDRSAWDGDAVRDDLHARVIEESTSRPRWAGRPGAATPSSSTRVPDWSRRRRAARRWYRAVDLLPVIQDRAPHQLTQRRLVDGPGGQGIVEAPQVRPCIAARPRCASDGTGPATVAASSSSNKASRRMPKRR